MFQRNQSSNISSYGTTSIEEICLPKFRICTQISLALFGCFVPEKLSHGCPISKKLTIYSRHQ